MPAVTYDNSISTLYLLQSANGNTNGSGYLRLFSITGYLGAETLNNVTNPTPARAYVPQDMSIDFKQSTKELFGEKKFSGHLVRVMRDVGRKGMHNDDPRARVDTRVLEVIFRFDSTPALPLGLRVDLHLPVRPGQAPS